MKYPLLAQVAPATLAVALMLPVTPAQAAQVEFTGRAAELSLLQIRSGIGPALTLIDAGVILSNQLQPATLSLVGSDTIAAAALVYSSDLRASWDVTQTYSLAQDGADVVLAAAGAFQMTSHATNCELSLCTERSDAGYTSRNAQTLYFTLGDVQPYQAAGTSAKDQLIKVQRWDEGSQTWADAAGWDWFRTYGGPAVIGPQALTDWSQSGQLAAGQYRVFNNLQNYGNPTYPVYSWSYTLRLADAELAQAVPEPATLVLMMAGLAGLLTWRRGRATQESPSATGGRINRQAGD